MTEELQLVTGQDKGSNYNSLLPQLHALIGDEKDTIANLSNITAALKQVFNFFWVGFYLVKEHELVLGPFQGTVACTRIAKGKGVCGTAWQEAKTIIVDDVDQFPGHIACSSLSKSEIVVPIFKGTHVVAVLDIDSSEYNSFDSIDREYLEELSRFISTFM